MIDISTTEILTNIKKDISRDPDINFPVHGKFQNPKFLVLTSREETLTRLVKLALKAPEMAYGQWRSHRGGRDCNPLN